MRKQPEHWSSLTLAWKIYFVRCTCSLWNTPKFFLALEVTKLFLHCIHLESNSATYCRDRRTQMHSLTGVSMSLSVLLHEPASIILPFSLTVSQLFDTNISHNGCSTFALVLETHAIGAVNPVISLWHILLTQGPNNDGSKTLHRGLPVEEVTRKVIALHSSCLIDLFFFSCAIVVLHSWNRVAKE